MIQISENTLNQFTAAKEKALHDFFILNEHTCASLSSRYFFNNTYKKDQRKSNILFIKENETMTISSCVYLSQYGFIHPLLMSNLNGEEKSFIKNQIAKQIKELTTLVGIKEDVEEVSKLLPLQAAFTCDYHIMAQKEQIPNCYFNPPLDNLVIKIACKQDLKKLLPLQIAYEKEEVITPIHSFSLEITSTNLYDILQNHVVVYAEHKGKIIAKAGTNARGIAFDQLGGIYVLPEYRKKGIGTYITAMLIKQLKAQDRQICLFVKKANPEAIRTYLKLGFAFMNDYRISYYK